MSEEQLSKLIPLSKAADTLVKKIASAVGILYEPRRIINKAKAEAEAEKIKALSKIEISEIEERAFKRMIYQESRNQKNIEDITSDAIKTLPNDAKVDNLDEDWIAYFFKQCEMISDKQLQIIWSKILSSEATQSGSFSKRTLETVSLLEKKDAELFSKLCQFVWFIGEPIPLIYDFKNPLYTNQGINFSALEHLESIGLISFNHMTGYLREGLPQNFRVLYIDEFIDIKFKAETQNNLMTGQVLFTSIGKELFPISGPTKNNDFKKFILEKWSKEEILV